MLSMKLTLKSKGPELDNASENFQARLYFEVLKDYSIEKVKKAVYLALKKLVWFPSPSEIIQLMEPVVDPTYWPSVKQLEHTENQLTREEAKVWLDRIFDRIEEARRKEAVKREKRFQENKAFLRSQSRLLLPDEGKA